MKIVKIKTNSIAYSPNKNENFYLNQENLTEEDRLKPGCIKSESKNKVIIDK